MKCILISGRTLQQGKSLEVGKTSEEYFRNVAVAFMNEDDMEAIGVEEGKTVRVSTRFGSTVVSCKKSKLDRGMIFMPFGPWTSVLTGADTQGTGMPDSKGIEAEVATTDEKLTTVPDILNTMRGHR